MNRPFYHRLYADLIRDKYPKKIEVCRKYIEKENWTALDVIKVNELLFGDKKQKQDIAIDKKHRAYDPQSVKNILIYQKKNKLSNSNISCKYGVSRNTIAKWKKLFPELA